MAEFRHPSPEEQIISRQFELANGETKTQVDARGGFTSRLQVAGVDIIVPFTPDNPKRSGIPRFGPVFGPVAGTNWERLYPGLPQHGTNRETTMNLVRQSPAELELEYVEGPARFAGVWQTKLLIQALPNGLRLNETVRNLEASPRERAVGFHPYLNGQGAGLVFLGDEAGRLFNNAPPIGEPRLHEGLPGVTYLYQGLQITLEFQPTPTRIVDWRASDSHRCIEPVWGSVGEGIMFAPEETKSFQFQITADPIRN